MRTVTIGAVAAAVLTPVVFGLFSGPGAHAGDGPTWHQTLDDGLSAARRTGRPVLVVTIWKPDV